MLLLGGAPSLIGCLGRTRVVPRTHVAPIVMDATLDQIVTQVDARFAAIRSMSATIEISGITGGSLQGEIHESLSLAGYLFVRKPEDLRIYLKVPIVSSLALDMASDGKTFKLYIPSRHKAIVGTNQIATPSRNSLENLRPDVFFDSLLVHGVGQDQLVSMTLDSHVVDNTANKKGDLIVVPEYQLSILARPGADKTAGREVHTLRVLHISRVDLMPDKQEIYNDAGQIVTRAAYSDYQDFNGIRYPTRIQIERPLDHYGLNLSLSKLAFNGTLEDDQFELKFPADVPIQKMD